MGLRIETVNAASADFIEVIVYGDDVSTELVFNADQAPLFIDYKGRLPDGFDPVSGQSINYTAAIAVVDTHSQITVTFDVAPPSDLNSPTGVVLQAFFNSL